MGGRLSIIASITLMVGVTVLIAGSGMYCFSERRVTNLYSAEKHRQIEALTGNIANSIKDYLAADDSQGLTQFVGKIIRDKEEIQFCVIRDSSGRVVFDSTLGHIGENFDPHREKWGENIRIIDKTVKSGTIKLGFLYIGYTIDPPVEAERAKNFVYVGKFIAAGVENLIKEYDFVHVGLLINYIGKAYPDILYITVYDRDRNVFDEYLKDKNIKPPTGKIEALSFSANSLKPVLVQKYRSANSVALDITALAQSDGETAGFVRLGYSMEGLAGEIKKQQVALILTGIFFLLAGVVFSLVIASRVSGPVRKISNAAHAVGRGDLGVKVEVHSGGRELRELAANFNEMVAGLRERDRIRDTFSKYVSKQVALELLSDPGKISLGGDRKDVVTLFCDICDFTAMSEKDPPEKVVEMLNDFFSEMVPIIFKYDGTLDKYMGDAFMAVFGSPLAVENAVDKALTCSIDIQNKMILLNDKWEKEGRRTFRIGIGLNYGPAISGNIGYEERMEYTVIGDSVNVASRMEKLTRKYDSNIIVTENLLNHATKKFKNRHLGRIQVKGKDEFIEIYEIVTDDSLRSV
jgi:class 3 adenylate cyclase